MKDNNVKVIHDQHVHSYYSFDSKQDIKSYLDNAVSLNLSYFVLTDHLDLNYLDTNKDFIYDFDKQIEELDKLQKSYPTIKILKGIEIGYKENRLNEINKIINTYHFDLINMSIHEGDNLDYYHKDIFDKGIDVIMHRYFDIMYEAINNFDFDVLTHLDYAFKTAYLVDNNCSIKDYESDLIKVMKCLIQKDKALEINSKVQNVLPETHTKYLLNLYKKLGGVNITLSSDAHSLDRYKDNYDYYVKLIKEAGFDHLNYFVNRKKYNYYI